MTLSTFEIVSEVIYTKGKISMFNLSLFSDRYAGIASLDEENEEEKWAERTELITKYGQLLLRSLSVLVSSLVRFPPIVLFSYFFSICTVGSKKRKSSRDVLN